MQISSIGSSAYQPAQAAGAFDKAKQAFRQLGAALDSGNLSDAKEALAQLQKNAPAQTDSQNNPMGAKIEALTKAVASGDLTAARQAYADVKKTITQNPQSGGMRAGGARGAGGPPRGGGRPGGAENSSSSKKASSSSTIYDKRDTNQDGTVSPMEELAYDLKHPGDATQSSTSSALGGLIDIAA